MAGPPEAALPALAADSNTNDIAHMRDAVLFDGPARRQRLTRFWTLLVLASVIAAAGVASNSTATVIGAMIVAPMMLPIQGTMLSTVLADHANLIRSMVLMVAGAAVAIGIGYAVGLLTPNAIVAATNPQVAGRVSPDLMDLLAALGTGIVGSIALVRRDISDTLPGVAIAISLVPPLTVVGLTLESGAPDQALGALLLFVTNVVAILGTGMVVMALYRIAQLSAATVAVTGRTVNRRHAVVLISVMAVIVVVPLTYTSITISTSTSRQNTVHSVAGSWATAAHWQLLGVTTTGSTGGTVTIDVTGPLPAPSTTALAQQLNAAGVDPSAVHVEFVPTYSVDLTTPGS